MSKEIKKEKKPLNNSETLVQRNEKGQLLPGSKLNPTGNEPGKMFSLLSILRAELQKCPSSKGKDKKTYASLIVKRMLKEATEKGDSNQVKLIWNYIEGMPQQKMELAGKDGSPLTILLKEIQGEKDVLDKKDDGTRTKRKPKE